MTHNSRKFSPQEWERVESTAHDTRYRNSLPFNFKDYKIDPELAIEYEDYCYKRGRRADGGHLMRRVFKIMDLKTIEGKGILDVGCGNGQCSVLFAMKGATSFGCDISPVGIQIAEAIANTNGVSHRCHFTVQNASSMNYPDGFFDIVLFREVLHHAIKYPGVRDETLRVLKRGGLVICAEGLKGNVFFQIARLFTMRGMEDRGDVMLTVPDLEKFTEGFSEYQLEMMSLFFMSKRIFRKYLCFAPARWLVFMCKKLDDVVLRLFPILKRYCGECIVVLRK